MTNTELSIELSTLITPILLEVASRCSESHPNTSKMLSQSSEVLSILASKLGIDSDLSGDELVEANLEQAVEEVLGEEDV